SATEVADIISAGAGVVTIDTLIAALPETEADAAGVVNKRVALDHRVTAAGPEVDAVLGKIVFT
ncbi:MAG: hypothetical protein GTN78_14945, partial [Gemmatimonadales bacterium]|nr:hypothetical protein [Gemmatimonadales bacterium]